MNQVPQLVVTSGTVSFYVNRVGSRFGCLYRDHSSARGYTLQGIYASEELAIEACYRYIQD